MSTSYDELWTTFLTKCKISDLDLPNSNERIYQTIHGALLSFNVAMEDNLKGDNDNEVLDRELDDGELLLLANYIRLDILENQLIYFTNTWQPFGREIGVRHYGAQLGRLEALIESQKDRINEMIVKMAD